MPPVYLAFRPPPSRFRPSPWRGAPSAEPKNLRTGLKMEDVHDFDSSVAVELLGRKRGQRERGRESHRRAGALREQQGSRAKPAAAAVE
jgi:hypothetical protein